MIAVEPQGPNAPSHSEAHAAEQGVIIARGTRVYLRTLTPSDLDHLAAWVEDPFLERMVGSELLHTYKHVWDKAPAFYQAVLTDPTQIVLVVEACRDSKGPVGIVRLYNIHLLDGYAFLETIIADPRAMKRGLGIQAGRLICAYALDVLGLRRIEAKVFEYNVLSINSLLKNGFRKEGVLRQAGFDGEHCWDVVVFGILREEMEAERRKDNPTLPVDSAPEDGGREPA